MNHDSKSEWLTLNETAEMLGVHCGTVRNWSNDGTLPVHRTSGGHRRYKRSEIELWLQTSRQMKTMEPSKAMQIALGQIRVQVAEGKLEAEGWYQKLDEEARMQYRLSGGKLMRGLINHLSTDAENSEAYSLGYEYASRARRYQLSSVEATQAFLFFRNILLEAVIGVYKDAHVLSGAAWSAMLHKMHTFTDEILLSLLKTYQQLEAVNK